MPQYALQTKPGNYVPSWWERNLWWLAGAGGLSAVLVSVVVVNLVAGGPRQPTRFNVRTVVPDDLPIDVDGEHSYKLERQGVPVTHDFVIRNTSNRRLALALRVKGPADCVSAVGFTGASCFELGAVACGELAVIGGLDPEHIACDMEVVGLTRDDGILEPGQSMTLRLSLTNVSGARLGTERILLLLSEVRPTY
jgi:hypothetical protein